MTKRMTGIWYIALCPKCEGFCFNYCNECDGLCEHDKICSRCKGNGHIVKFEENWKFLMAWGIDKPNMITTFPQKKIAAQALQDDIDTFGRWTGQEK